MILTGTKLPVETPSTRIPREELGLGYSDDEASPRFAMRYDEYLIEARFALMKRYALYLRPYTTSVLSIRALRSWSGMLCTYDHAYLVLDRGSHVLQGRVRSLMLRAYTRGYGVKRPSGL